MGDLHSDAGPLNETIAEIDVLSAAIREENAAAAGAGGARAERLGQPLSFAERLGGAARGGAVDWAGRSA